MSNMLKKIRNPSKLEKFSEKMETFAMNAIVGAGFWSSAYALFHLFRG